MTDVEYFLTFYRRNIAGVKVLELEREKLLKGKVFPDNVKYINSRSIIELSSGSKSKGESIVERAVTKLEKYEEKRLKEIDRELFELKHHISQTECLISALGDIERFIIEKVFFAGLHMDTIAELYFEKYDGAITTRTLRSKKRAAIKIMSEIHDSIKDLVRA